MARSLRTLFPRAAFRIDRHHNSMPIEDAENSNAPWPVRPLTRTRRSDGSPYHREPDVEAQIRELSGLPNRERLRRLLDTESGWEDSQRAREETLVYFIRAYTTHGDDNSAWEIARLLERRTAGRIRRQLGRWRLSQDDIEDCERDLSIALYEALFDPSPTSEFWEARFWKCLDRRLWNLVEKRQAIIDSERSPGDQDADMEEDAADRLLVGQADSTAGPEEQALLQEARSILTKNELDAMYLVFTLGLPEESDDPERPSAARELGVTGRSIRNYLRRAREKLAKWQLGEEKGNTRGR